MKEKVKLESVVDLIKDQLKENRKSLRQEIEFLKQENKTLKTKLQKTISNNKDTLEEVDYLHNENNVLSIIVRDLKNQIADLDVSELANKNKIKDLTTSCRKLETENNTLRYDSCDCKIRNPSMSRQNQNKGQNVNHDPSRTFIRLWDRVLFQLEGICDIVRLNFVLLTIASEFPPEILI